MFVGPISTIASLNDDGDPEPKMAREGNRIILSSNTFSIEVNAKGTVPFYHFNTSIDNAEFFLKFDKLTQYNDTNDNGFFDQNEGLGSLALSSVSWAFETITESASTIEFSFRSTDINKQGFENTEIALINHFTGDTPGVKFDIFISNWPFETDATALLLEFSFTWSRKGGNEGSMKLNKEATDTMISLKNNDSVTLAYFESVSDIVVNGTTQENAAVLYDDAPAKASRMSIFINYPKFDGNMTHDPAFASTNVAVEGDENTGVINGFLILTTVSTIMITTLMRNKKKTRK